MISCRAFDFGQGVVMFKLDSGVWHGLSCDVDGLRLGSACFLVARTDSALQAPYLARSRRDLQRLLDAGYGPGLDAGRLHKRLTYIAELMSEGHLAQAQISALQLCLPELSDSTLAHLSKADALLKSDPYHLPPGPGGGEFASANGVRGGSPANPAPTPSAPIFSLDWPAPGRGYDGVLGDDLTYDGQPGHLYQVDAGALNLKTAQRHALASGIRQNISSIATSYVGSTAWSDNAAYGPFGPGANKCFLFVRDVVAKAGAFVPLHFSGTRLQWVPPSASDWADTTQSWPGLAGDFLAPTRRLKLGMWRLSS